MTMLAGRRNGVARRREARTSSLRHAPVGLVVNADDWGCDRATTDAILPCLRSGAVSAVSAMVFMSDSERAAGLAREHAVDAGLHLNFTTQFSACPDATVAAHHRRAAGYLLRHRFAQAMFHPGLLASFAHLVAAQVEEFERLYGAPPARIDGHHHMHLCANVLAQRLLPADTWVRRTCSLRPGEKGSVNRAYRRWIDRHLAGRHVLADYLFNLHPVSPGSRLRAIVELGRRALVELETHPVRPDEYRLLQEGWLQRWAVPRWPSPSGGTSPDEGER